MKKMLVTGATGFIGSRVVERLLQLGYTVTATSATPQKAKALPWYDQVTYIPFDFKTFHPETDYFTFFGKPDAVLHLAWEGLPNYKSAFHYENNLPRQYALLKNMIVHGLTDLTVAGTCLEYGMQEGCLSESHFSDPRFAYPLAKDVLRKFLQQVQRAHPFYLKWVRLFYMYGEGQSSQSFYTMLNEAITRGDTTFNMSGGEQTRDFLPVEEVTQNLCAIAGQTEVTGIINCCSGNPVTLKEFAARIINERNATISLNFGYYPYPDYEPMHFWGDTTKLKTIIQHERRN